MSSLMNDKVVDASQVAPVILLRPANLALNLLAVACAVTYAIQR